MVSSRKFCRIGTHAFVSGVTGVVLDIPPYMLAAGSRAKLYGLNTVGLKRQNFREETIRALKTTYRIIFRSGLTLEKAIHKVKESGLTLVPEVEHLVQFLQQTKRGICR